MNQKQIKYLDGRITDEAKAIREKLDHDFNERKEKLFNELAVKQDEEYGKMLESLSKEQLTDRMLRLFRESRIKYYDTRDYTAKDNFSNLDTSACFKRQALFEFGSFLDDFDKTAVQKFSILYKDYNEFIDKLNVEVNRLRDRINIGEASDAIESLDAFIDRWNKIVFAATTDEVGDSTKKTRKRK
jgi:hypothetical protein